MVSLLNFSDVFSTLVALWHSYSVDSAFKTVFTFFAVSYHGLQAFLFALMCCYVFRVKRYLPSLNLDRLHQRPSCGESQEDRTQGAKCMVLMYSPVMANVKFVGSLSAFVSVASNETNYFN